MTIAKAMIFAFMRHHHKNAHVTLLTLLILFLANSHARVEVTNNALILLIVHIDLNGGTYKENNSLINCRCTWLS